MNPRDALHENDCIPADCLEPVTACPLCGEPASPHAQLCDECERRENDLYRLNNSIPDDRGVATGDDPRR